MVCQELCIIPYGNWPHNHFTGWGYLLKDLRSLTRPCSKEIISLGQDILTVHKVTVDTGLDAICSGSTKLKFEFLTNVKQQLEIHVNLQQPRESMRSLADALIRI